MTKNQAAGLFGTTHAGLARKLNLTRQAVSRWPSDLTDVQTDRVLGAALRLRVRIPRELIEPRPIRTASPRLAADPLTSAVAG
jgi:hypothetical protein